LYYCNVNLQTGIQYIKGIGPKKAEVLNKSIGIKTVGDLLEYYPFRYDDRSHFLKIKDIVSSSIAIQIVGKIVNFSTVNKGRKRLVANFEDDTGSIELIWFQGIKWVQQSLKTDTHYIIYGKPNFYKNNISFIHPEMEPYEQFKQKYATPFQPVYPLTETLKNHYVNNKTFVKVFQTIIPEVYNQISETLPQWILDKYKLISKCDAIKEIHLPSNPQKLEKARFRLKFEELFYIQLKILSNKVLREQKQQGFVFTKVGDYFNTFYKKNLSFELTGDQKRVVREIRKDCGSGKQMNRLLQGDVGSGKTLVALMSMLIALDNGYQAALMVPTEILAQQHFQSFKKFLKALDINVELLTGSTSAKEKNRIKKSILTGETQILIGTHALIEDTVQFKNLALVVIDEQHRFGVAQRAKMWIKNTLVPHILVMTATPIPRTLAMTFYGDLDVSTINEMPPGRKPVITKHIRESSRLRAYGFMREQIEKGKQAYIVYPLIKESEKLDFENLVTGYQQVQSYFPPPKYVVGMLHGKMKPKEKEDEMALFLKRQIHILVSTTVIEVGVDVPNATLMIIESAERFGLSQLHQLRGRVGRDKDQSFCILITKNAISDTTKKRMNIMVNSNDGFQIAEEDLKLRGPGDMEGTQQSGTPFNLKIAELAKDTSIIIMVRELAIRILDKDSLLEKQENRLLRNQLIKLQNRETDWGKIS